MCSGTTIAYAISAIAAVGSAYNTKRTNDKAEDRSIRAFRYNAAEKNREDSSRIARATQTLDSFKANNSRAEARDEERVRAEKVAVDAPIEEIENSAQGFLDKIEDRQLALDEDLNVSEAKGEQELGADATGNISEVFVDAANRAKDKNLTDAKRSNALLASVLGAGDLQRSNIDAITKAGQEANILQGGISRRRQLDNSLHNLSLNKAELDNTLAPNNVVLI